MDKKEPVDVNYPPTHVPVNVEKLLEDEINGHLTEEEFHVKIRQVAADLKWAKERWDWWQEMAFGYKANSEHYKTMFLGARAAHKKAEDELDVFIATDNKRMLKAQEAIDAD